MQNLSMRICGIFLFLIAFSGAAWAEGFALYEYSARSIALGGAAMARKPDASCIASNPALLSRLPGTHMMIGATVIRPDGSMKTTSPGGESQTTNLESSTWAIPHAYFTHQISDKLAFGVGEFTRFGLGFDYPSDWPGRFNIYGVELQTFSLNPNLAVAFTDQFSMAAGVEVLYANLDLKKRATFPGLPASVFEVDTDIKGADDVGYGFNLAAHYQFDEQWAAGLAYRSQVRVKAFGDTTYTKITDNTPGGMGDMLMQNVFNNGQTHSTVILPDSVSGGIAFSPIPELSLEAGVVWTRWSTFRNLRIHMPGPVGAKDSFKYWDDSWRFNVGVEYEPLDWLVLRAGYVYDQSPMSEANEDYLVPTDGRNIYSAGLGFNLDSWTVDLGYAFIDPKGRSYEARPQDGVLSSKAEGDSHIVSMSIGYEF